MRLFLKLLQSKRWGTNRCLPEVIHSVGCKILHLHANDPKHHSLLVQHDLTRHGSVLLPLSLHSHDAATFNLYLLPWMKVWLKELHFQIQRKFKWLKKVHWRKSFVVAFRNYSCNCMNTDRSTFPLNGRILSANTFICFFFEILILQHNILKLSYATNSSLCPSWNRHVTVTLL